MSTNGKTLKIRAAKLKGFTVLTVHLTHFITEAIIITQIYKINN